MCVVCVWCVCVCVFWSPLGLGSLRLEVWVGTAGDRGSGILGLSVNGIVLFIDLTYFR